MECIKNEKTMDKQRTDEHLEVLCWILEQSDWQNDIMIIKGSEYNRFMQSDIEDDIMDMQIVECDDFYVRFKEITGVDLMELDDFISMSYIDKGHNDIEITVNINSNNERFIIGA